MPLTLTIDGDSEDVKTDYFGLFEKEDLIPGLCSLKVILDNNYKRPASSEYEKKGDEVEKKLIRGKLKEIQLDNCSHYLIKLLLNNEVWSK